MADVLTPEQRRKNMQHTKSNDTKIEVLLWKALWQKGYRYRRNYKELEQKLKAAETAKVDSLSQALGVMKKYSKEEALTPPMCLI